jgi:hypothetical protein
MAIERTGAVGSSAAGTVNIAGATHTQSSSSMDFTAVLLNSSGGSKLNLDEIFQAASEKYNVPVNLLKAVAKAESNFNPDATSPCGAMGIMQLMPGTAASLGVTDPYDPVQSIMGGAKYLGQMLDKFDGDMKLAVAAYNAGPGAVTKYGGIPPYKETQNYVKKVMGYLGLNITAGSVNAADSPFSLQSTLLTGTPGSGLSDISDLTGMSGLPGMLETLSDDPDSMKDALLTTVYQLQLQMMSSGEDKDNVIV